MTVSVTVNVAVGNGVNVRVIVGGEKVPVGVWDGVAISVGVRLGPAVAVGGVTVTVGEAVGVPADGALRMATIPAQ